MVERGGGGLKLPSRPWSLIVRSRSYQYFHKISLPHLHWDISVRGILPPFPPLGCNWLWFIELSVSIALCFDLNKKSILNFSWNSLDRFFREVILLRWKSWWIASGIDSLGRELQQIAVCTYLRQSSCVLVDGRLTTQLPVRMCNSIKIPWREIESLDRPPLGKVAVQQNLRWGSLEMKTWNLWFWNMQNFIEIQRRE